MFIKLYIIIFLFFLITFDVAALTHGNNDSTGINGCWLSSQSQSGESVYDSLYNANYYFVHLTICIDEYNNIEIIKKIKLDCCNEDTHSFQGKYRIQNDTIIITINESGIFEKYTYNVNSKTLLLTPLNISSADLNLADSPKLKYRWTRY